MKVSNAIRFSQLSNSQKYACGYAMGKVTNLIVYIMVDFFYVCMYICQTLRDRSNWHKLLRLPC